MHGIWVYSRATRMSAPECLEPLRLMNVTIVFHQTRNGETINELDNKQTLFSSSGDRVTITWKLGAF